MEEGTPYCGGNTEVTSFHDEARRTLDRIGDTWTMLVIFVLRGGPLRFAQLQREVTGISQRMLSRTLRSLERDGLVTRTVYATTPPAVEYALTPTGHSLKNAVYPLIEWAAHHHERLAAARDAYDTAAVNPVVTAAGDSER